MTWLGRPSFWACTLASALGVMLLTVNGNTWAKHVGAMVVGAAVGVAYQLRPR